MRGGICEGETRGVSTRPDDRRRCPLTRETAELSPRGDGAANRLPVAPDLRSIQRMQIEENVREFGGRKNVPLDAALSADEERLNVGTQLLQRAGYRQPGIEVPARAATGKEDARPW